MKKLFLVSLLLLAGRLSAQNFYNPLTIPDTLAGSSMALTLAPGNMEFWPGVFTPTMGANGDFLGPTLLMNKGDSVSIDVVNLLGESTTLHWHGLHVPPEFDGGPHTVIGDGDTWSVNFKVMNDAATYWYHPHLHMNTEMHVYKGIAGFIYVRDTAEAALDLPRAYGIDDFPLVIQDRSFDTAGALVMTPLPDSMMVNGTLHPYLNLPASVVRLRLLNGSTARNYNLGFSDNRNFHVIASDAGLLEQPFATNRLLITNGERYEILVDLGTDQGDTLHLMSYAASMGTDIPGGSNSMAGTSPLNMIDFAFLELRVGAPPINPVTSVPANLITHNPLSPASASVNRQKLISGMGSHVMGNFFINGLPFDISFINDTVQLDAIETWELINTSNVAHPFHIHDISFWIYDVNGAAPPPQWAGQKDVFLVRPDDTIRFVTRFSDFVSNPTPYMYHCHNLRHEDDGMMGHFVVLDSNAAFTQTTHLPLHLKAWPNPSASVWNFEVDTQGETWVVISDAEGRVLLHETFHTPAFRLETELPKGLYLARLESEGKNCTLKLLKW